MSDFAVTVDGDPGGQRVLLLHGFPQDLGCWGRVVELLVADGFRCARFDQRGYDPAVRPAEVDDYALPALVADAVAVLDELGWSDALVVGHDWGSIVAWGLAAWHPERVRGLVAVSVPHPGAYSRALASDPDQQARSAYIGLFRGPTGHAENVLLADGGRRLRAAYGDVPEAAVDGYVARFLEPGALTAALAWYRAMDRMALAAMEPVSRPTRFVWGADDVAVGRVAAEACGAFVTGAVGSGDGDRLADGGTAGGAAGGAGYGDGARDGAKDGARDGARDYAFVELAGVSHWVPETAPGSIVAAVRSLTMKP